MIFPVLSFRSTRYGIAFITHFCNFILMTQYAAINISMVAMVNGTNRQSQFNGSTESLPLDALGGSNDAPNSLPAEVSNTRFKLCSCFCCLFRAYMLKSFIWGGAPGWLSQLSVRFLRFWLRSWSHGSWVRALHWAPRWQHRGCLGFSLSLPLSLPHPCSCSLSLSK